jgi:hypothetical protein
MIDTRTGYDEVVGRGVEIEGSSVLNERRR